MVTVLYFGKSVRVWLVCVCVCDIIYTNKDYNRNIGFKFFYMIRNAERQTGRGIKNRWDTHLAHVEQTRQLLSCLAKLISWD